MQLSALAVAALVANPCAHHGEAVVKTLEEPSTVIVLMTALNMHVISAVTTLMTTAVLILVVKHFVLLEHFVMIPALDLVAMMTTHVSTLIP
jgi:hypothetical protein